MTSQTALEQLDTGVIVLDRIGRVILANRAAERFASAVGLGLGARTSVHAAAGVVRTMLDAVLSGGTGGSAAVGTPAGAVCRVTIAPFPAGMLFGLNLLPRDRAPCALILITGQSTTFPLTDLQRLFGLTEAEAHVATAVASGASAREIAAARGTSVFTVRAQIRSVLEKTGARGVRALGHLLSSAP